VKERQPPERRWNCHLLLDRLPWSIVADRAIGESPRSCTVEECR
jgi:hypothetical protein